MSPPTSRLRLAPLTQADAEEIFRIRGDADAMRHWDWPQDESPGETATVVEGMLREVAAGEARHWTLRLKSGNRFVGICDLSDLRAGSATAEVGFMLAREFWGRGLAREAVEALAAEARGMELTSLSARIHSANTRSARLLLGMGFSIVGAEYEMQVRPGVFRYCTNFVADLQAIEEARPRQFGTG
jgi:ribosomal-protein-alanine N-acetyltransferase